MADGVHGTPRLRDRQRPSTVKSVLKQDNAAGRRMESVLIRFVRRFWSVAS